MVNINMSYEDLLESICEGKFYESGIYGVSDGIVEISGDCGEEIEFIEIGNIQIGFIGNELRKVV